MKFTIEDTVNAILRNKQDFNGDGGGGVTFISVWKERLIMLH